MFSDEFTESAYGMTLLWYNPKHYLFLGLLQENTIARMVDCDMED